MAIQYLLGATNLAKNPSFVSGFTYWETTNGTLTYSTAEKWSGTSSGEFTVSAVAASLGVRTDDTNTGTAEIRISPGQPLSVACRVKGQQSNRAGRIEVLWRSAANATLSTVSGPWQIIDHLDYTTLKLEGLIAPASTDYAIVRVLDIATSANVGGLTNSAPAVGNKFFVDGADIRIAETIDTYIDGDQGPNYGWTGTPHQSESFRNAVQVTRQSGRRGLIQIHPRIYRADKLNNLIEDISPYVLAGSVEMRSDRAVKMAFKGTIKDSDILNAYTDYLAPFMRLEYSDGTVIDEQMGLYSLAPMVETATEHFHTGEFDGKDLTWNLSQASFSGRYSVPAGTNYVTRIVAILEAEGFTRHAIPTTTKTLPKAMTWKEGASKLTIINDLLNAIGYYTLFCNRQGVLQSFPYNDLDTVQPAVTLFSGKGSTVVGAISREPLTDRIVNMVKVIREDPTNAANSIYYERINDNPDSPVSTVNLQRTIFIEITDTTIESLEVAQEIARKVLQDAASLYTKYQIQTLPDPRRSVFEVYDTAIYMHNGREILKGKVRVDGWDIGFTPQTAVMTHYAHRLEAY